MTGKTLVLWVVIVFSLAGTLFMMKGGRGGSAQRRDLAKELAAFVAAQVAQSGEKGAALVLAPMDDASDPFPATLAKRMVSQLEGTGFSPVEVVQVPYNVAIESSGEPITRGDFLAALQAHPQSRLVVTLVGIPRLRDAELPASGRPRIVVASNVLMPYLASLPHGMVDFAIEVKRNAVTDERQSPELGELGRYFVLTRFPR